jgi:hypothetical protein
VANDPNSGTIETEDCVFVFGDEVYDSGHADGWVEIHPVKHVQKICPRQEYLADADFNDPNCCPGAPTDSDRFQSAQFIAEVKKFWDTWCNAIRISRDPGTKGEQQQPQNIWCLHPLVDGCTADDGGIQ